MEYEWDEGKAATNIGKHGVSFQAAVSFDWSTALVKEDDRKPYGEKRYKAAGYIENRLHIMVFTVRKTTVRLISLRRANRREVAYYHEQTEE